MAHSQQLPSGLIIWWPDKITVGRFRLLPELSPRENLFRLLSIQRSVWLCKYHIWAKSKHEMELLETDELLAIYNHLRNKVLTHTYRKDLSLYQNCYGSAWAVTSSVITTWKRRLDREQGVVSLDVQGDREGWADSFAMNEVPRLLTDGETRELANARRKKPRVTMNPRARKALELREYNDAVAYAYDDYVAECEMLGVTPIGRDEYLGKNFTSPC